MAQLMYRNPDTNEYEKLSIEPLDCYPIGSFYISYESTSPADIIGGTWTQITSRFLYATTNTNAGGTSSHKHHVPFFWDKPSYDTTQMRLLSWHDANGAPIHGYYTEYNAQAHLLALHFQINTNLIAGNSNTSPAYNMYSSTTSSLPPYQGVYMWRRTA